jgi:hypothetical protein
MALGDSHRRAALIEPKTVRALAPDPESPRRKNVVAAALLSTKSFVDSGTEVDPALVFAANLELLGDELFAEPSPTTIKKAGTRS